MIRVLLAAACIVFSAAIAQAAGLDDLKAAKAAAEQGKADEAVRLFGQALAAGDLSPADKVEAYKGRASEYTGKSLIADAFERLDQGRQARGDAIADFTAALKLKTDDAALYVARAQVYALDGQSDPAIADFDRRAQARQLAGHSGAARPQPDSPRATTIARSPTTTPRIALPAKPAKDAKETGPDAADLYERARLRRNSSPRVMPRPPPISTRRSTHGTASRAGDVLWLPYQAAWLHVARARAGQNDAEELARNAGKVDLKQWPGTLIAFFLGQAKIDELTPPSPHGAMGHARECNLSFFAGEQALAKKDDAEAARAFHARARGVQHPHRAISRHRRRIEAPGEITRKLKRPASRAARAA